MMKAINAFTAEHLQQLEGEDFILPEAAPDYLVPLITSGAMIILNNLTPKPTRKVYLTEARNNSWLTLMNVLVHEGVHAYHGSINSREATQPLLKIVTYLSIPIIEGIAFDRELEFHTILTEILHTDQPTPVQQEVLNLFGASAPERQRRLTALEMETRIWRVLRLIRAVFDVEVNLGMKTYVDFIKWASERTGLSRKLIHNECFTFLPSPGYAPSYAVCGTVYDEIQAEQLKKGVSTKSFHTQACNMGYWPWSICMDKMREFTELDED